MDRSVAELSLRWSPNTPKTAASRAPVAPDAFHDRIGQIARGQSWTPHSSCGRIILLRSGTVPPGSSFVARSTEGLSVAQQAMQRLGHNPAMMGGLGMALGFLGRCGEARAMLNELAAAERERYVSPIDRALIDLGLGETGAFFERLERAVHERDPHVFELPFKPSYDGVRDDPRFRALLRTMRLA